MMLADTAAKSHERVRDSAPAQEFAFGDKEFNQIATIVRDHTGIVLGRQKKTMAYSRLVRRLRLLGLTSFKDYCGLLKSEEGRDELGFLINAITTNLTKFFREAHHFDHLRDVAIPEAVAGDAGQRKLRVWSAGCSTGEEPYSIAMILAATPRLPASWDRRILATDLDTNVLSTASDGIYGDAVTRDLPPAMLKQFMRPEGGGQTWKVDDRLRAIIAFNQLNLLGDWPFKGGFDAIFCRNVMIYFDGPTKQRLVTRLTQKLKVGGWLYIGHSESLLDHHPDLRLAGRTIYQKTAHGH